jgi:hypothetical protein
VLPLESVLPILVHHERKMPDDKREVADTHLGWQSYCQSYEGWDKDEFLWHRAWRLYPW